MADSKASHGAFAGRSAQEGPLEVVLCGGTWLCRYGGGQAGQPVGLRCSQF